jgi:hypothetical protein
LHSDLHAVAVDTAIGVENFGIETLAYGVVGLIQADVHQKIEWLTENHRTSGTSQRQGRAAKCRDQQGGSE